MTDTSPTSDVPADLTTEPMADVPADATSTEDSPPSTPAAPDTASEETSSGATPTESEPAVEPDLPPATPPGSDVLVPTGLPSSPEEKQAQINAGIRPGVTSTQAAAMADIEHGIDSVKAWFDFLKDAFNRARSL